MILNTKKIQTSQIILMTMRKMKENQRNTRKMGSQKTKKILQIGTRMRMPYERK